MDDSGSPALEVGFEIDTAGAFGSLVALDGQIDSSVANAVQEFERVKRATKGMVDLGGATVEIGAFGNAATRMARDLARERSVAEKTGEGLIRQLERETAALGRTKDERRALRIEEAIAAAEQVKNTDLVNRLREAEAANYDRKFALARQARFEAEAAAEAERAASERAAMALRAEAAAVQQLAQEKARLVAAVRGSFDAQQADAAAAERLRASTDPLYAATSRLNAEIAESTRLYYAGATAPAEYARQQAVLTGRLQAAAQAHDASSVAARRGIGTMTQLSFQLNDIATMAAMGAPPMQIFASQAGQIFQGAQMADGGLRGFAASMGRVALVAAPYAAALAVAGVAFGRWKDAVNDDAGMKAYAASLGLTRAELKKLGDVSVTTGDLFGGMWDTIQDRLGMEFNAKKIIDYLFAPGDAQQIGNFVAEIYGLFAGGYQGIVSTWSRLPAAFGDLFVQAVNASVGAIEAMVNKAIAAVNGFAQRANALIGKDLFGMIGTVDIAEMANPYEGAGRAVADRFIGGIRGKKQEAIAGIADFLEDSAAAAIRRARGKVDTRAAGLIADRTDKKDAAVKLTAEQRAYQAALKAANDYISAQEKEAARIGKTAREVRLMEDAIQRLAAPMEAQKLAMDQVAIKREAAYSAEAAKAFQANVMQPLRDEIALHGLVGAARATAALELEKDAFLATHVDAGVAGAAARWREYRDAKLSIIKLDDAAEREAAAIQRVKDDLDALVDAAYRAGDAMGRAFGRAGGAIGDAVAILAEYKAAQALIDTNKDLTAAKAQAQSAQLQLTTTTNLISATKGLFSERSKGYKAMEAAEKALAIVQLARTAIAVANGAANMFASLGPAGFPAVAAMLGVMASLGFSGGGSSRKPESSNTGTGTVFGDSDAKSESIKRAIDGLREVDVLMLSSSRQMAASLRSIESQIGGFAALVVRSGDINASGGVREGFRSDTTGKLLNGLVGGGLLSKVPVIGGIVNGVGNLLGSLFGSKTSVTASGLYGGAQSLGSILGGGFDASTFSDITKTKKFLGLKTGTSSSTQFGAADAGLENQFTLILRSFNDAIAAAAGPLGQATDAVQARLNGFVVNIGKIDLQGLTGAEIEERLTAVFGAAADNMANAAFPGFQRFQKVGEGAFETLVRVASTVEAVTDALSGLGTATAALSIDAKVGLAGQFDSIGDFSSAVQTYAERFYSQAEQAAARAAQMDRAFAGLGLAMPGTLAAFRELVDAQDLTTTAGQSAYATLLQLAPAFADLKASMEGAKSAADVLAERGDLERRLLELRGDTAAIRALDLAKLDASNRGLQQQIYAMQDAQEAARAADELRRAWGDVGRGIEDEIRRIRGLTDPTGGTGFAALQGQFNATTLAARGGDQDAAKLLPGISQAMLKAAEDAATSRQELNRVQAMTASSLEATFAAIQRYAATATPAQSAEAMLAAMAVAPGGGAVAAAANDDTADAIRALREELAQLRAENNAGHAATASNTGRTARKLEDVTAASGGEAISVASAA